MGSTRSKFSFAWYGSVQMLFRIRDEAFSMLGFGSFSRLWYFVNTGVALHYFWMS